MPLRYRLTSLPFETTKNNSEREKQQQQIKQSKIGEKGLKSCTKKHSIIFTKDFFYCQKCSLISFALHKNSENEDRPS